MTAGGRTLTLFAGYAARKIEEAAGASIGNLVTEIESTAGGSLIPIGNDWTRSRFDGDFWLSPAPADRPAVSLVLVESRDGNTVADNPADLGGGDTDRHLIYEGLSRVAADAVLAGARTAQGDVFFSVWHPRLVALRELLGLPRHPAQIVISQNGRIDFVDTLLFNVPEVPVFLLAGPRCRERIRPQLSGRPWIQLIPIDDSDLGTGFRDLAGLGIRRISCVGGRVTATALIDAGLVQDLYLTTTEVYAGRNGTAYYAGARMPLWRHVVQKRLDAPAGSGFVFEHRIAV